MASVGYKKGVGRTKVGRSVRWVDSGRVKGRHGQDALSTCMKPSKEKNNFSLKSNASPTNEHEQEADPSAIGLLAGCRLLVMMVLCRVFILFLGSASCVHPSCSSPSHHHVILKHLCSLASFSHFSSSSLSCDFSCCPISSPP